jgi:hypothetical protein
VAAGVMLAMGVAACGKRGAPLPPLRPVPAAVSDLSIERVGSSVTVRFTVPAGNMDGSTPPAVEKVDVFAVSLPATTPAPTAAQLLVEANLVSTVQIRSADARPADAPPAGAPPDARPAPGDVAMVVDKLTGGLGDATAPVMRYFSVVPVSGRRRGPASPALRVPLSITAPAPGDLKVDYTEQTLTLSWQPAAAAHRFVVEEVDESPGAPSKRLSATPIEGRTFDMAVQFGSARCFVVRAVDSQDSVSIVGDPTTPVCVTPVDHFAPAAPTDFLALPGDAGVELAWTAVSAPDLAGYVVLRGDDPNGTLQRLTTALVTATTYRDSSARAGATYVYAVVAVDKATPPNESEPSNRRIVTARLGPAR